MVHQLSISSAFLKNQTAACLTLGALANVAESMTPPAWKFDSDPMENHDWAEATEASDRAEADTADLPERLEP